jgi:hypothetical protein
VNKGNKFHNRKSTSRQSITQVSTEPAPDSSILASTLPPDEKQPEAKLSGHRGEVQEPSLEHIYTIGSLGNTLTWGDQQIPELVDEVVDIQAISYDRKRKSIMKRTTKKRRLTLDSSILITTEEKLISTEHAKTSELIGAGMEITDATLDRERKDEEELATVLKELEHLHHLEKYYQDSTQATVFLRSEFQDAYNKFTSERHLFTTGIVDFQEDTLMALATCKDMEIWYEKAHQAVERIDYIKCGSKGSRRRRAHIRVLRDNNIDRIRKSTEYWVKMAQEPHQEIQEKWVDCERSWTKINRAMRDIGLPEFGTPEDFVDLHDIVKLHAEQDSSWTAEIEKVANMVPGQVQ